MANKPFLVLDEPVLVDLGDGIERPLQFPIITLRRLQTAIGRPTMGRKSCLLDLDESVLPEVIFHGLCDPKTGDAPAFGDRKLELDDILVLPATALGYMLTKISEAYTQQLPEAKEKNAPPPPTTEATAKTTT